MKRAIAGAPSLGGANFFDFADLPLGVCLDPDPAAGGGTGQGAGSGGDDPAAAAAAAAAEAAKTADANKSADANALRAQLETANQRLKDLEAAEQARKDAELSETERLKKQADDARKEAQEAKVEAMRMRHAKDLPAEALEFVTATDEAGIKAQVEKLAAIYGQSAEGGQTRPPVKAGTQTQPLGNQQPTAQEKIGAAMKAGNPLQAIQLMRQQQFQKS